MPRNDCIFTFDIAQIKYEWIYKLFIVQLQIDLSSITFLLKRQGWDTQSARSTYQSRQGHFCAYVGYIQPVCCLSRLIFHLFTLLSLITWNTPLVFVLKGYLFNFIRLCEFSLPLNGVLSNLLSPCLIKSRNEGESALSGETKQRLQRWLCLK